jgi:hypothetical protein
MPITANLQKEKKDYEKHQIFTGNRNFGFRYGV